MRFDLRAGLPAPHDQEGAHQVDRPRAPVVPARRDQHRATSRRTASRSGTNGPTRTATSARSTATSGARWPAPDGAAHRPARERGRRDQAQPGFAAAHRVGVERRRHPAHEAAAVPRVLPVLRGGRPAVVPALPAQRGHLPRRAVQHRVVRAADAHGRAAMRPRRRRLRLDRRRLPPVPQPPRAGGRRSSRARPIRCRASCCRRKPPTLFDYAYDDIEIADYQSHPALKAPVAV